jgi:hypothetical protein
MLCVSTPASAALCVEGLWVVGQSAAVIRPEPGENGRRIGAILTICSSRKSRPAPVAATPKLVPFGSQHEVAQKWVEGLSNQPAQLRARELYAGRAFQLARQVSSTTGAPLFVISAGLGLVSAEANVPSYGLTVSGAGPESVRSRISGAFSEKLWFEAVLAGPFSTRLESVFDETDGLVLVALTRPYARMAGDVLGRLGPEAERLRLFGAGLCDVLPRALSKYVMPYDARLEAILPGTRADFSQRALMDFASCIVPLGEHELCMHSAAVRRRLAGFAAPVAPIRARLTDREILALMRARIANGEDTSLRWLRDKENVACEQGRFVRLRAQLAASGGL